MSNQSGSSDSSMPQWPAWLWDGRTVGIAIADPPDRFLTRLDGSASELDLGKLAGRQNPDGSLVLSWNSWRGRRGRLSFQDEAFNGTVVPYRGGSLIRGKFQIDTWTILFSILWLVLTIPWAASGLRGVLQGQTGGLIFVIPTGAFLAFHTLGRIVALKREPRVVQMLEELGSVSAS